MGGWVQKEGKMCLHNKSTAPNSIQKDLEKGKKYYVLNYNRFDLTLFGLAHGYDNHP